MVNVLIITAHPSKEGFAHKIAKRYEVVSKVNKNKVEVLDLYKTKLQQKFLVFEDRKKMPQTKELKEMQKKISWADELVFVFPVWWSGAPAILKNFIDTNFSSHFAFKYENGKVVGLLKGKVAKVFVTCDGPGIFYKMFLVPVWKMGILGYCGLKVKSFIIFDRMRNRNEMKREEFLKLVEKLSNKNL